MPAIGYEFLRQSLDLAALSPKRPAAIKPVTRVVHSDDSIAVPPAVAPGTGDPLAHLLFRLH